MKTLKKAPVREETKKEGSKYHVPNLERALQMLEILAKHPAGLGVTEISKLLSVPKNSAYRIATTLLDMGYLYREEGSKQYSLSGKLLSVGYAAIGDQNLMEKSMDIMRDLRDVVRETVLIGVILNGEGIVLEQVPSLHSFKFWIDVGTRFPMHAAAPSKAMLAFLPESEKIKVCQRIDFKVFNRHTINSLDKFYGVLKQVKKDGYAMDAGEEVEGMHCVAAPIFNRYGSPVAAIWITGPIERVPESAFADIGKMVKEHAMRISHRLGYYEQSLS